MKVVSQIEVSSDIRNLWDSFSPESVQAINNEINRLRQVYPDYWENGLLRPDPRVEPLVEEFAKQFYRLDLGRGIYKVI